MWIISFLVSTGFCIFFIYSAVVDFLKYDIVTTIKVTKVNSIGEVFLFLEHIEYVSNISKLKYK
jgi:hypothetical protein